MSARTDRYKWVALSNTTIGMLMATINSSIVLIALPDIFRGIHLDPLEPGNSGYLLWMLMGFLVATAVLVVSFGRIGDMYGRVRMFNFGFAIFTAGSILLSLTWMDGSSAARWLIAMRIVQGVGGALLMANSSAILTDAFPHDERGLALGINAVSAIAGSFIGLVLGGVLAPVSWRLVFLVSVPVGILGTLWSWWRLEERGERHPAKIDWWGNLTFAVGLIAVLVGITYGIQPYGGHTMGWTNPAVLLELFGGLAVLGLFVLIELRTEEPMFRLGLFRIRAFTAGSIASLLASLGRGGLMFMLIIWLQGIWLPLHGYSFSETPLWAGHLHAAADRRIPRRRAGVGMALGPLRRAAVRDRRHAARGAAFFLLELLPVNFHYWMFAALLLLIGLAMGLFASPNQTGIMNSLPPHRRGVGAGMSATFQNSAMVLSIGVFFTLMVVGLAASLPATLEPRAHRAGRSRSGRAPRGAPAAGRAAVRVVPRPEPDRPAARPVLHHLPAANATYLTGRSFFPSLMSGPFASGLDEAFDFAIVACLIAAGASWMRGGRYVHDLEPRHSFRPSRSTASSRFRRRATDRPTAGGGASGVGDASVRGCGGWVGVRGRWRSAVDCLGDVGRAGALRVGLLEACAQLGPGVASRSRPGGSVESGWRDGPGLPCVWLAVRHPRRLPHPQQRPSRSPARFAAAGTRRWRAAVHSDTLTPYPRRTTGSFRECGRRRSHTPAAWSAPCGPYTGWGGSQTARGELGGWRVACGSRGVA